MERVANREILIFFHIHKYRLKSHKVFPPIVKFFRSFYELLKVVRVV